ncbi:hypothetical protein HBH43_077820 [Parastagonospora nodorum]|nr:hypothetical protein HBH43_077820 [Parastagonospora nodorum]
MADEQNKRNGTSLETHVTEADMEKSDVNSATIAPPEANLDNFSPYDISTAPKIISGLPPEIWTIIQAAPAKFPPQYFLDVSRNLLENPNLTASHLARAELSYQSFADATYNPKATTPEDLASIVKHLRPECQPRLVEGGVEGYDLEWTVVRKLIPRNPNLDKPMMQTCHLYTSTQAIAITTPAGQEETVQAERYLVIYIPHAEAPDDIPFYHPTVRSLGILYTYLPNQSILPSPGTLSIHFAFFPTHPLDTRLTRTALMLLQIIHKHAKGRQAGYKKRVHHDVIIPQKRFQDTYAYLKGKYAKALIDGWVEQTPPEKHVFEDLGIAAFLIELWRDMYGSTTFPGFVDIGCGNGVLVYILNAEGWNGWGFDARRRKTWATFGEDKDRVKEMLLVPRVLGERDGDAAAVEHDGVFPRGTFVVSNHADELTPWTPLIASLSRSPFIAIPCCSHDFGGARTRAPVHRKYVQEDPNVMGKKENKQPSAYAGLCSWVSHLTESMGYKVEKEHLRIPSTRNIAILGRSRLGDDEVDGEEGLEERLGITREVVEKEMGESTTIEQVRSMWMRSGGDLMKSGKSGH